MNTVRLQTPFGKQRATPAEELCAPKPASRVARMLAFAVHIERLIESGRLRDYAAAAKVVGVTRARISQISALLNLPPRIQEAILLGELKTSERALRLVSRDLNQRTDDC